MPILKQEDVVAGIDSRLSSLPRRLQEAGLDVPERLSTALDAARWKSPAPDLTDSLAAVSDATTEADFQAAVMELSRDLAVADALRSTTVRHAVTTHHQRVVVDAFGDVYHALMAATIDRYNTLASEFTDVFNRLPNMDEVGSVFDLDPTSAADLQEAKRLADQMASVLDIYESLAGLTKQPINMAAAIGDYESGNHLDQAGQWIRTYAGPNAGHLGPLSPHAAVLNVGGTLRLKTPAEAQELAEDLLSVYYTAENPPRVRDWV